MTNLRWVLIALAGTALAGGKTEVRVSPLLPKETKAEKQERMAWWTHDRFGMFIDSCSKGGNLLLNVGPTARGEFDRRAVERLDAIGVWMRVNSRSIYGCTAAPEGFVAPEGTKLTYNPKTNRLYLHIFEYPVNLLPIPFAHKIVYAQFLHDGSEVKIAQPLHVSGTLRANVDASLHLPVLKPDVEFPVVEMYLK